MRFSEPDYYLANEYCSQYSFKWYGLIMYFVTQTTKQYKCNRKKKE